MKHIVFLCMIFLGMPYTLFGGGGYSYAQVSSDKTLPRASNVSVSPNNTDFEITGGSRSGNNLFHSFQSFSVPEGGSVVFQGTQGIRNIFSRVTGRNISRIDGLLEVPGNADFFLLNPNGIVFGSGSSLDIGGSFHASTANRIHFNDGSTFSTNSGSPDLLTMSTPSGLQVGKSAGSIAITGENFSPFFMLNPDTTFALVSQGITIENGFVAIEGGRVELGSVSGDAFVSLAPVTNGWDLGYSEVAQFNDIQLSNFTGIDTSGEDGGLIQLTGKGIYINSSASLIADTLGNQRERSLSIDINASEVLEISDDGFLSTAAFASGTGGSIAITAPRVLVQGGSSINTSTEGIGDSGDIDIEASESLLVSGLLSTINAQSVISASGNSGDVLIETKNLTVSDNGQISNATFGEGNSGLIRISTNDLLISNDSAVNVSSEQGVAGNLAVSASLIQLDNRGKLESNSVFGEGGNIDLDNLSLLLLRGNSQITTNAGNNGSGGSIDIDADVLLALPGANSDITANALDGTGGRIRINAQKIFGLTELSFEEIQFLRPDDLDPAELPSNDITAISQSGNPTFNGQVIINTPEVDPSDSTTELSEGINIPPKLAQVCRAGQALGNGQFANVGSGGLPPSPTSLRSYPSVWYDLRPPSSFPQVSSDFKLTPSPQTSPIPPIIEAKGWISTSKGLMLIASKQVSSASELTALSSC